MMSWDDVRHQLDGSKVGVYQRCIGRSDMGIDMNHGQRRVMLYMFGYGVCLQGLNGMTENTRCVQPNDEASLRHMHFMR